MAAPPRPAAAPVPPAAAPPAARPAARPPPEAARTRESFGFETGAPARPAAPPTALEEDWGDLGLTEKGPAAGPARPGTAPQVVPKEIALEEAAAAPGPAPIELSSEKPREVELAPTHAFVPPAAATGHQPEPGAKPPGDSGEAALREALSKASLDVIERVVWEVVPQLAETIIRENLERLVKERQGS